MKWCEFTQRQLQNSNHAPQTLSTSHQSPSFAPGFAFRLDSVEDCLVILTSYNMTPTSPTTGHRQDVWHVHKCAWQINKERGLYSMTRHKYREGHGSKISTLDLEGFTSSLTHRDLKIALATRSSCDGIPFWCRSGGGGRGCGLRVRHLGAFPFRVATRASSSPRFVNPRGRSRGSSGGGNNRAWKGKVEPDNSKKERNQKQTTASVKAIHHLKDNFCQKDAD